MFTKPFQQLSKKDVKIAGGKGASLGEMTQAKIPVPPGFVVLASAFERFLEKTDINMEIEAMWKRINIKDVENIKENSEIIRDVILKKKFPEKLAKEILATFDKLGTKYVAVRSSATAEDSKIDAWAGQLESYLYVKKDNLLESIQKCWASLYTPRALFYRVERKLHRKQVSVAVVVQKMVNAEVSGVCFTVHPVTQDKDQMIIEAGWGLGETLVQGIITPDSYVLEKSIFNLIDININSQEKQIIRGKKGIKTVVVPKTKKEKQKLSGKQIIQLAKVCLQIERHYQSPQDIEWALEKGKFYITQSRPITTLDRIQKERVEEDKNIESKIKKYKFEKFEEFPVTPVVFWLESCKADINNPYYKRLNVKIFPKMIVTQSAYMKIWEVNKSKIIIDKWREIEFISKESEGFIEKNGPILDKMINEFKESKLSYKDFLRKLNEINLELYYTYIFFNGECFRTNNKKFLEFLPVLRIRISDFATKMWKGYGLLLRKISKEYDYPVNVLNSCTSEELMVIIENKKTNIKENRPIAVVLLGNRMEVITGDKALRIENILEEMNKLDRERLSIDAFQGTPSFKGYAKGKVVILLAKDYYNKKTLKSFMDKKDYILITPMTRPEIVPYLKNVKAIITDEGGITSHAAIVSRELKIPCIISTKVATQVLKDGYLVEVDAEKGIVKILQREK